MHFSVVPLSARDYRKTLEDAAAQGVVGGKVYDALLLAAARKSEATRIYTFNVSHFQSLADGDLRQRIVSP